MALMEAKAFPAEGYLGRGSTFLEKFGEILLWAEYFSRDTDSLSWRQ